MNRLYCESLFFSKEVAMGLGTPELIIIFVVALIVFGPRKLPELGRSLGKSLSEFKRASNELRSTLDEEIRLEDRRAAAAASQTPAVTAPSTPLGDDGGTGNVVNPDVAPAHADTVARGEQRA
jgi:TatA/E family protein of Tat protein translocase